MSVARSHHRLQPRGPAFGTRVRRSILASASVVLSLLLFSGCAGLKGVECNYDAAYAFGMNQARHGKPMVPSWATSGCPEAVHGDVTLGYREGYTAGVGGRPSAAPARSQARPQFARAKGASAVAVEGRCTGDQDCNAGRCRDRGDGITICMHKGQSGDGCRFSSDCDSGLFCKDPGNGLRACM